MSTRISNLVDCSEGPVWKDFMLVPSAVKTDLWNLFFFFTYYKKNRISGIMWGPVKYIKVLNVWLGPIPV